MKDEEIFKAWKREQYKDQSTEEKMEFVEHLHTFPKYFEKTFLAGLKAGRPQWQDLWKAPNDLPKRNNENTDRSDVVITDKGIAHYNFRKQKWYVHNFECDMSFSEDIIAWCEIPTFDKE